jgi:hypothetical protein
LAFEIGVNIDAAGYWLLQYLAAGNNRCSYLGIETMYDRDDGTMEIRHVDLADISICTDPYFSETCVWRSDMEDWRDLPLHARQLRDRWHHCRREPLPDAYAPKLRSTTAPPAAVFNRRPPNLDSSDRQLCPGMSPRFVGAMFDLARAQRHVATLIFD